MSDSKRFVGIQRSSWEMCWKTFAAIEIDGYAILNDNGAPLLFSDTDQARGYLQGLRSRNIEIAGLVEIVDVAVLHQSEVHSFIDAERAAQLEKNPKVTA